MSTDGARPAVFLDRDGVVIEEAGLLVDATRIRIAPGVPAALARLGHAGFELVVVTNQTVVARGLTSEEGVAEIHRAVAERLAAEGGPVVSSFYVCPHHPNADVAAYRLACDCRKPRPGLILRAAAELRLDLRRSFMVGDRITDIAAGARAGCRTVLIRAGGYLEPPIETVEPLEPNLRADHICDDVPAAVDWILAA